MSEEEVRLHRLRRVAVRVDSDPRLVRLLRGVRDRLPGDDGLGARRGAALEAVSRGYEALAPGRSSAAHELGLGALQVWQALSERAGRGRGDVDVAILFTDLVGFSSWALDVGDEAAVELLRTVATHTDRAVEEQGGTVVKQLGDGAMAVFPTSEAAATAALDVLDALEAVEVAGHRPTLRAGLHHGRPRRIAGDFLGVDVNIAARVMAAGRSHGLLATEGTAAALDEARYEFGRAKKLKAPGTPGGLRVRSVRRRATV